LRVIWDELESYRPNPIYACNPKCSCDTFSNVLERKKQDHVMQFLRGLNDQFSTVRFNFLMMDPLPSIAKVFSYAVKQERKNGFPHNPSSRGGRSGSTGFGRGNSGGRGNKICIHCGLNNHIVDECYRNHGYPPGHKYHKPQDSLVNHVN
ncbi:hypothetical protein glysoja_031466, partial [Glycine soja]